MVTKSKLLIVDDDGLLRQALADPLADRGYVCFEAEDGRSALACLHAHPEIAIALVDIYMPHMSGLDLVAEMRWGGDRSIETIVMTGNGGVDEAVEALRRGASDFIVKPFPIPDLVAAIERCEDRLEKRRRERQERLDLETGIASKTARVDQLVEEIDIAQVATVETLAIAAEHRDDDTGAHIRRIGDYAALLAQILGWSEERAHVVRMAAMLHDVGKIGVPDAILLKPGPLTPDERQVMQAHTEIGYRIVSQSSSAFMRCAAEIARSHHERWDGSGYPAGLSGPEIPDGARIVGLCDVYDALRSARPYKAAFDHDAARAIILQGDGRTAPGHFDPEVLDAFRRHGDELAAIFTASETASAFRHSPLVPRRFRNGVEERERSSMPLIGGLKKAAILP